MPGATHLSFIRGGSAGGSNPQPFNPIQNLGAELMCAPGLWTFIAELLCGLKARWQSTILIERINIHARQF